MSSLCSYPNTYGVPLFVHQKELASDSEKPHMCAYKLVTVHFKWWGLQNNMESLIHKVLSMYQNKHVIYLLSISHLFCHSFVIILQHFSLAWSFYLFISFTVIQMHMQISDECLKLIITSFKGRCVNIRDIPVFQKALSSHLAAPGWVRGLWNRG